jgi:uncharacterized Fe-S cluster-containing radical SAM superfamily enzyme
MKEKTKTKQPPLEAPKHVGEIFGDELVLAGVANGHVHLTFAAKRIFPPADQNQLPTVKREVVCRLILTGEATNVMMNKLIQLSQTNALAKVPVAGGEKAN